MSETREKELVFQEATERARQVIINKVRDRAGSDKFQLSDQLHDQAEHFFALAKTTKDPEDLKRAYEVVLKAHRGDNELIKECIELIGYFIWPYDIETFIKMLIDARLFKEARTLIKKIDYIDKLECNIYLYQATKERKDYRLIKKFIRKIRKSSYKIDEAKVTYAFGHIISGIIDKLVQLGEYELARKFLARFPFELEVGRAYRWHLYKGTKSEEDLEIMRKIMADPKISTESKNEFDIGFAELTTKKTDYELVRKCISAKTTFDQKTEDFVDLFEITGDIRDFELAKKAIEDGMKNDPSESAMCYFRGGYIGRLVQLAKASVKFGNLEKAREVVKCIPDGQDSYDPVQCKINALLAIAKSSKEEKDFEEVRKLALKGKSFFYLKKLFKMTNNPNDLELIRKNMKLEAGHYLDLAYVSKDKRDLERAQEIIETNKDDDGYEYWLMRLAYVAYGSQKDFLQARSILNKITSNMREYYLKDLIKMLANDNQFKPALEAASDIKALDYQIEVYISIAEACRE